jgi:hypothetical protein
MARHHSITSRSARPAVKRTIKQYPILLLFMLMIALILSSAKTIGFLLPYINKQIF